MTAPVGIGPNLRAALAAHVAFQYVDWRCLCPADDVQRDLLVCVAAKAADFKVEKTGIECIIEGRDGCAGPL
jgi:hypothetical protein